MEKKELYELNIVVEKTEKEEKEDNLTKQYKEKDIGLFFQSLIDKYINQVFKDLTNYYEIGDWKNCSVLVQKISANNIFKLFKKDKKIKFLDLIATKLLPEIYYYSRIYVNSIIEFLSLNVKHIPKDYTFSWKFFYNKTQ